MNILCKKLKNYYINYFMYLYNVCYCFCDFMNNTLRSSRVLVGKFSPLLRDSIFPPSSFT